MSTNLAPKTDFSWFVFAIAVLTFNFVAVTQGIFVVMLLSMMAYVTVVGDLRRIARDKRAEAQAKEAADHANRGELPPPKK